MLGASLTSRGRCSSNAALALVVAGIVLATVAGISGAAVAVSDEHVLLERLRTLLPAPEAEPLAFIWPHLGPVGSFHGLQLSDRTEVWLKGRPDAVTGWTLLSSEGLLAYDVSVDGDRVVWTFPTLDQIAFDFGDPGTTRVTIRSARTLPPCTWELVIEDAGEVVSMTVDLDVTAHTLNPAYGTPRSVRGASFDQMLRPGPRAGTGEESGIDCPTLIGGAWDGAEMLCAFLSFRNSKGKYGKAMNLACTAAGRQLGSLIESVEDPAAHSLLAAVKETIDVLCEVGGAVSDGIDAGASVLEVIGLANPWSWPCFAFNHGSSAYEIWNGMSAKKALQGAVCESFVDCGDKVWIATELSCGCPPGTRDDGNECACEQNGFTYDPQTHRCEQGGGESPQGAGMEIGHETPPPGEETAEQDSCEGRPIDPDTGACAEDRCGEMHCAPGHRPNFATCACEPECPDGWARDDRGECVEICPGGYRDPVTGRCIAIEDDCANPCGPGFFLNPFPDDGEPAECISCQEGRGLLCGKLDRLFLVQLDYVEIMARELLGSSNVLPGCESCDVVAMDTNLLMDRMLCARCNVVSMYRDCMREASTVISGDPPSAEGLDTFDWSRRRPGFSNPYEGRAVGERDPYHD